MRVVLFIKLRPGDKVEMEPEDGGLVLRRESRRAAKLKRGKFWWQRRGRKSHVR